MGRKVIGWVAVLAGMAALFVVIAGVFRPAALEVAEPVLCSRPGETLDPTSGAELEAMRRSVGADYAIFCTSDAMGVQEATGRWFVMWIGLLVIAILAMVVRAKVTPPRLRAPVLPAGR